MRNTIPLFCNLLVFFSCSQNSFTNYDSEKGYSFAYSDEEWKIEENPNQTFLFNKLGKKSDFGSNINIIVQDLSSTPISLEDYHNLTLKQMEEALGRNTVQSDKEIKVSGILAKEIVYTMPQNTIGNSSELKLKQVYFIKNNKAYLITYTAKINDFTTNLKTANKVFETFKVE